LLKKKTSDIGSKPFDPGRLKLPKRQGWVEYLPTWMFEESPATGKGDVCSLDQIAARHMLSFCKPLHSLSVRQRRRRRPSKILGQQALLELSTGFPRPVSHPCIPKLYPQAIDLPAKFGMAAPNRVERFVSNDSERRRCSHDINELG
jgi:hypothetical protein